MVKIELTIYPSNTLCICHGTNPICKGPSQSRRTKACAETTNPEYSRAEAEVPEPTFRAIHHICLPELSPGLIMSNLIFSDQKQILSVKLIPIHLTYNIRNIFPQMPAAHFGSSTVRLRIQTYTKSNMALQSSRCRRPAARHLVSETIYTCKRRP